MLARPSEEIRIGGWRSASGSRARRREVPSRSSSSTSQPEIGCRARTAMTLMRRRYTGSGALSWTLYVRQTDVGPGEVVCIPRGVVHRFDNDHEADAKMLAIITPGILGPAYFREMAEVIEASTGGPPDPAALGEVMRRHGLTPAP